MKLPSLLVMLFGGLLLAFPSCTSSDEVQDDSLPPIDSTFQTVDTNEKPAPKEKSSFEERLANYESKDRVLWQKPDLVIDGLGDITDKTIADIGAGSGYFARRLAHKAKKVIAIDIDQNFIDFMDSIKLVELPKEHQERFTTRLATPEDANLQPGEADIALLVNTYIYIPERVEYLNNLKKGLAPGGKIVIVDFKKKRIPKQYNTPARIRVPLYLVEQEVEQAGYDLVYSDDTSLDYQYIVMAKKR